jgi:hypothetical protein
LLAACKVDVEGAPCGAPGSTADCPSGQACGVDGRCSAGAEQCLDASERCVLGTSRCSPEGNRIETCTAAAPCGAWEFLPGNPDCGHSGLVCAGGEAPACACPGGFAGPKFVADPVAGSASGAPPFPTGAASPSQCRFKSLGDAISRASAVAGPATVQAYGASGANVVFDASSGDGPIAIPANVTVIAAAGAAATTLHAAASSGTPLVTLAGTLQGLTLDARDAGVAVQTSCGTSTPSLSGVTVDGGGTAAVGVAVSGACGGALSNVVVTSVAGPALWVGAEGAANVVVTGGSLRGSQVGALVTGGQVSLGSGSASSGVDVGGNSGEGVLFQAGAVIDAQLTFATIHDNGGTGVVVDRVSAGSAVALRSCLVRANGTTAPRMYGGGTPQRPAGGVIVIQPALPFTFTGNQVSRNAGDQLVFDSSAQTWTIAVGRCQDTNTFSCVSDGALAVAVNGGKVDATNTYWPGIPVSAYAGPGVTATPYCNNSGPQWPATPPCP